MKRRKILYGVCGIGSGHTYRQLPIIEKLAADTSVIIFAYDTSLQRYAEYFESNPNVIVLEVAVPYYVGNKTGLDFEATAIRAEASGVNYIAKNAGAMHAASQLMGKPDLVITDYEPVSAQYAYAYNAPLITIDQQSKYLGGEFPSNLADQSFADEVMRLGMFFPTASVRIACSFFGVTPKKGGMDVTIVPPVIRSEIIKLKARRKSNPKNIVVYLSAQSGLRQSLEQLGAVLGAQKDYRFHVFIAASPDTYSNMDQGNVTFYSHGAPEFDQLLGNCAGIISTAGHSLLAEAMYLSVPVYAIPLPLYEQQMNADIIDRHGFGIKAETVTAKRLSSFLARIQEFVHNIENDRQVLLRSNGLPVVLDLIEAKYRPKE